MFIEVPILCNNNTTNHLKELEIEVTEAMFDVRIGKINTNLLLAYYPDSTGDTIVSVGGEEFSVMMSYKDFDKLICK